MEDQHQGLEDAEPLSVASFCYAYGKLEYFEKSVLAARSEGVDPFEKENIHLATSSN